LQTTREMIQYLQARNIQVVFFTPPYYEAYITSYQLADPQAMQGMVETMQALRQEFGIEYYNYAADPTFSADFRLYKDSDHLNLCGKEQFSQSLSQSMQAWALRRK
jgi:hypothetical protein